MAIKRDSLTSLEGKSSIGVFEEIYETWFRVMEIQDLPIDMLTL